jgi:predicted transposase YbfD/YdcC
VRQEIPSESTVQRTLRHVNLTELEACLAGFSSGLDQAIQVSVLVGQAIDGKAVRGASHHGRPVQLVSLVRHGQGQVLAQAAVPDGSNELTAAPRVLAGRCPPGSVTTGDALLTQTALAELILQQGGDYLMVVKDNQPRLYSAIALHFHRRAEAAQAFRTVEKGHGRLEQRLLEVFPAPAHVRWPGVAQIMRRTCTRRHLRTGRSSCEVSYGVTSLAPQRADARQLETLWRGHWTIENSVHYVRDVTLREDACQAHVGSSPQALAALRNAILTLLRHTGHTNIADAIRLYAARPADALRLIGAPQP